MAGRAGRREASLEKWGGRKGRAGHRLAESAGVCAISCFWRAERQKLHAGYTLWEASPFTGPMESREGEVEGGSVRRREARLACSSSHSLQDGRRHTTHAGEGMSGAGMTAGAAAAAAGLTCWCQHAKRGS